MILTIINYDEVAEESKKNKEKKDSSPESFKKYCSLC